ncbi:MAG TPA: PCRF domain-containing protein, partial [Gammaproteobacteria bacterium]|nr:PCRF domain-containing protein [Gammaproteobacteria bacterium]
MKPSISHKLEALVERFEEVGVLLSEPDVIADQDRFRRLSMEYAQLEPVVKTFRDYQQATDDLASAQEMLQDPDAELRAMAADESEAAQVRQQTLNTELQKLLLPRDPHDSSNIF